MRQRDVIADLAAAATSHTPTDRAYLKTEIARHEVMAKDARAHASSPHASPHMKKLAHRVARTHDAHRVFLSSVLANADAPPTPPDQLLA